jgi:hypothetical protein
MKPLTLSVDPEVLAVAEFMQRRIPAARLLGVAAGMHALAPLLWGDYASERVHAIRLLADDPHILSAASGSCPDSERAGDDSAEAADDSV